MGEAEVRKKLCNLGQQALDVAKKSGCEEAKVVASRSESWRVTVEADTFSLANSLTSNGFGVLVHKDRRKGSSTVNSVNADDLMRAVEAASTIATYSVPDEFLNMPDKREAPPAKKLEWLWDERVLDFDQVKIQRLMAEILKDELAVKGLALDRFEVGAGTSWQVLMNSHGVVQEEQQTSVSWSFVGMARAGDQVSGMDYTSNFSFRWDGTEAQIRSDAARFADDILKNLNPSKCPPYRGMILLSPRAARSLLYSTVLFHASGSAVMDEKSRWIKRVGEKVCNDLLTIMDRPHEKSLGGATAYDSDGLPTRDNGIIRQGVLVQHLHGCYSARRTGQHSTASAGGPFGLVVEPGNQTKDKLLSARNELLLVNRFSGNVDPLTGDFSGVVKSSRLIRDGKDCGPVLETMIAGNVFEIMQGIVGISTERECVSGSYLSPWILVEPVTVS